MKNFKTERKRLEKGCGKPFSGKCSFGACRKNDLCPTCKTKLTTMNECEEICRDIIDDEIKLIEEIKKEDYSDSPRCCEINYGLQERVKELEELKQNLFGEKLI